MLKINAVIWKNYPAVNINKKSDIQGYTIYRKIILVFALKYFGVLSEIRKTCEKVKCKQKATYIYY